MRRASFSMAITFFARRRSASVSIPSPGPISKTISSPFGHAVSAMLRATAGALKNSAPAIFFGAMFIKGKARPYDIREGEALPGMALVNKGVFDDHSSTRSEKRRMRAKSNNGFVSTELSGRIPPAYSKKLEYAYSCRYFSEDFFVSDP